MTIAQQLKIKDFPFIITDKNGNTIYREFSDGSWFKREYDSNGKVIYYENSNGYWFKREYDSNGDEIYCENSNGYIYDNRPKIVEVTLEEIAKMTSKAKNGYTLIELLITITIIVGLSAISFPLGFSIRDKSEYDANGKEIYYEESYGFWNKSEYDFNGNEIYYENSYGVIIDKRPKTIEVSLEKIANMLGIKVEQLRIKD